jgi:hypothetical protein
MEALEIHCIYTYGDSIMKPTKQCLKQGNKRMGKWEYNGRVNLFKVYYMHIWNYHNEISLRLLIHDLSKIFKFLTNYLFKSRSKKKYMQ